MTPRSSRCHARFVLSTSILLWGFLVTSVWHAIVSTPAPVGQRGGGVKVNLKMSVPGNSWRVIGGACLVGSPNNLVVDVIGPSFEGRNRPQPLIVTGPSASLCQWLSGRAHLHEARKEKWEAALQQQKSKHHWLRFWTRFSLWMKSFPEIRIVATVTYVDFADTDGSSVAAPWITATFAYEPPPFEDGFGVFDDIAGSFAPYPGAAAKEVTLLLNPSPSFNMPEPDDQQISSEQHLWEVFSVLGKDVEHQQQSRAVFSVPRGPYLEQPVKLTLKLADLWSDGGDCLIRGTFLVQWNELNSLCQVVNKASKDPVTTYVADKLDTVTLSVYSMEFFAGTVPVISAEISVTPAPLSLNSHLKELHGKSVELGILTDPSLRKRFLLSKRILAGFRLVKAAGLIDAISRP